MKIFRGLSDKYLNPSSVDGTCQYYKEQRRDPLNNRIFCVFLGIILTQLLLMAGCSIAHASINTNIDLNAIAEIESSGDPFAYNKTSGATGMYQITQGVVSQFNKEYRGGERGFWAYTINNMYNELDGWLVADWYLNTKIPIYLERFNIPDTVSSRLIAYNYGIGHLKKWFKRGAHENQLPLETRNYIKRYFKEMGQSLEIEEGHINRKQPSLQVGRRYRNG